MTILLYLVLYYLGVAIAYYLGKKTQKQQLQWWKDRAYEMNDEIVRLKKLLPPNKGRKEKI